MQGPLLILAVRLFWSQLVSSSSAQGTAQSQDAVRVRVPVPPNEIYPPYGRTRHCGGDT